MKKLIYLCVGPNVWGRDYSISGAVKQARNPRRYKVFSFPVEAHPNVHEVTGEIYFTKLAGVKPEDMGRLVDEKPKKRVAPVGLADWKLIETALQLRMEACKDNGETREAVLWENTLTKVRRQLEKP